MNRISICTSFIFLATLNTVAQAGDSRNNLISLYGINSEVENTKENTVGIFYNTEEVKVRLDKGADLYNAAALLKFNPLENKGYIKIGVDYMNRKIGGEQTDTYYGSLGLGYMVLDDVYVEVGSSINKLNGGLTVPDQTTKQMYADITKRFDTSAGTLDTSLSCGNIGSEFTENKNFYKIGMDYYPVNNARLAYVYSRIEGNTSNNFSLAYGYLIAAYRNSLSYDARTITLGVQFAFADMLDISSYTMPTNIKLHLSE
ncbi:MAG: hypothetical protein M0P91_06220 [Sulfuricurvum sp.]|jgi:hypothetical protein|uniref:hypothetical protein n=1 Tax=Sulfuricurvum sp. TaxID=2025608 RepID=UPI0025CBF7F9|nr:hypothetical protein [Sulfuricurvum sp.]MCK9372773.1 hypothetical protein [Sulfuricurvum sp.]